MFGEYITADAPEGFSLWVRVGSETCALIWWDGEIDERLGREGLVQYCEWPDDPSVMTSHGYIAGELW